MMYVIEDKKLYNFYNMLKNNNVPENMLQKYRKLFTKTLPGYYKGMNIIRAAFVIADYLHKRVYHFDPHLIRDFLGLETVCESTEHIRVMLKEYKQALEHLSMNVEETWNFIEYYNGHIELEDVIYKDKALLKTLYTFGRKIEIIDKRINIDEPIYKPIYTNENMIKILLKNEPKLIDNQGIYEWLSIINNWYKQYKKHKGGKIMKTDYEYFQELKKDNVLLKKMAETFIPPVKDKSQYMKDYINSEGLFDALNGLYYTYIMYLTDTISSQFLEPIIDFIYAETHKDKEEIQNKLLGHIHEAVFELSRDEYDELRYQATKLKDLL